MDVSGFVMIVGPWAAAAMACIAVFLAVKAQWNRARLAFTAAIFAMCVGGIGAGLILSNSRMLVAMTTGTIVTAVVLYFDLRSKRGSAEGLGS